MGYKLGIDVGSTTLKLIVLDDDNKICFKSYERHFSKVRELLLARTKELEGVLKGKSIKVAITGSAGLGIADASEIPFVQEVFGVSNLVRMAYPDADSVIELGGEDAKIIFLGQTVEERMNSTCAGGTGAFIDQMATLLNVTADELDELSLKATDIYPIASRCGVFAKTDIQPLINQGASKENIAASIYRAVVDQTITGLAQGHRISGKVLFLGGPLTFLKGLQMAFKKTLELSDENAVFPPNAEFYAALGAAVYAEGLENIYTYEKIIEVLLAASHAKNKLTTMPPLFKDGEDYRAFVERHNASHTLRAPAGYSGKAYLGIDAGSTTTKLTLIDEQFRLLYTYYAQNKGNPLDIVCEQLKKIYCDFPNIEICGSAVTGYGEELIKTAFNVDIGIVETVAHYTAAQYFNPDVDFIIDIGGQDMKCFGIKNGVVDSVVLNEACSSGCGSFLETFAASLGYNIVDFAKLSLYAKAPVDLGTRCTVFMNSSVKQAQKNGADIEDISAGLAFSIVKNAIYKVLRVSDAKRLGKHIVVQGGTFLNDAVLRAFEQLLGSDVTRPDIAGLMGAFGAALVAKKAAKATSKLISSAQLEGFTHSSAFVRCGLCTNKCGLTVNTFSGNRKLISGNRCEKPLHTQATEKLPNLYEFKRDYLFAFNSCDGHRGTIGLPLALNFYDTLPLWFTFFKNLGFGVRVSDVSSRSLYRDGQHTIPSDTICYGAKLVHGHILNLEDKDVDGIFYPCMSYNFNEHMSDNCYHCPVVAYYPEVIKNNIGYMKEIKYLYPYLALNDRKFMAKTLCKELLALDSTLKLKDVTRALDDGFAALSDYRDAVLREGASALDYAKAHDKKIIVLAGRPYHIDPEISHGIDGLISSLGFVVLSEDSVPPSAVPGRNVLNQWSYHARMYHAADFVSTLPHAELVQLISFGCGLDAVTSDEVKRILVSHSKLYTQLKIDEINNLGAVKIRIRSLMAAMQERG